jgi:hypothetical protein
MNPNPNRLSFGSVLKGAFIAPFLFATNHLAVVLGCAVFCLGGCGNQEPHVEPETVVMISCNPDTGANLWTGSGLKMVYRWSAQPAISPTSDLKIHLELDRKGGGVVSCPLGSSLPSRHGSDSGVLLLTSLTKAQVVRPTTGRLVLTETVEGSMVRFLAKSPNLSWAN